MCQTLTSYRSFLEGKGREKGRFQQLPAVPPVTRRSRNQGIDAAARSRGPTARSSSINGQWIPLPEGESSARFRSTGDARASRTEHFSQGIDTDRSSITTMSASGVVSIAFAKTGFVLLCTIPSETFPPRNNDLIEMLKDYLARLASQTRRAVVFEILDDIEAVRMKPVLAL